MKYIIYGLIAWIVFFYLSWVFIELDFNPAVWDYFSRVMFICVVLIGVAVSGLYGSKI